MKQPRSVPRNRRGFTLVEVMAVVVVMALLASAAALTFAGPLRRATAREAVDRVASFDESCRRYATRFDRDAEMVLLVDGTMALRPAVPPAAGRSRARLPSGVRFNRVRVAGDRGRNAAFGDLSVPVRASGPALRMQWN